MHARTEQANKRTKARPFRIPRGVISVTLIAGLLGIAAAFGTSTLDVYRLERAAAELARTKQQLQDQNDLLHEEIRLLHTSGYIEKLAREQLGLVKPGEIAILVVHPPPPPPAAATPHAEQVSWAARLWATLAQLFGR